MWLIEGKLGSQGLLHGTMPTPLAEALAKTLEGLGVEVVREESPYPCRAEPRPITAAVQQRELFDRG